MINQALESLYIDDKYFPFTNLYHSVNYYAIRYRKDLDLEERECLKKLSFWLSEYADKTTNKKPSLLLPFVVADKLAFNPLELNDDQIFILECSIMIFETSILKLFNGKFDLADSS